MMQGGMWVALGHPTPAAPPPPDTMEAFMTTIQIFLSNAFLMMALTGLALAGLQAQDVSGWWVRPLSALSSEAN